MEPALAKLTKLKAQARSSVAHARIKYSKQTERGGLAVKSKTKEMAGASDEYWE